MSRSIPILLFHQVTHKPGPMATTPDVFERHLAWLAERGYRSLTLDEFQRNLTGNARDDGRPRVLLTFDDGYADLNSVIAPALRRYGFTGIAFVITGEAAPAEGSPPGTPGNPNHLSWNQTRALASEGVLEFHSHSHTHSAWSMAPDEVATVRDDLATSIDILAAEMRLPRSTFRHLAWPWGRSTLAWEAVAKELGFTHQYLVQRGAVNHGRANTRLPRIGCDSMSTASLARWVGILSSGFGALACNRVFGTYRAKRHGIGYV